MRSRSTPRSWKTPAGSRRGEITDALAGRNDALRVPPAARHRPPPDPGLARRLTSRNRALTVVRALFCVQHLLGTLGHLTRTATLARACAEGRLGGHRRIRRRARCRGSTSAGPGWCSFRPRGSPIAASRSWWTSAERRSMMSGRPAGEIGCLRSTGRSIPTLSSPSCFRSGGASSGSSCCRCSTGARPIGLAPAGLASPARCGTSWWNHRSPNVPGRCWTSCAGYYDSGARTRGPSLRVPGRHLSPCRRDRRPHRVHRLRRQSIGGAAGGCGGDGAGKRGGDRLRRGAAQSAGGFLQPRSSPRPGYPASPMPAGGCWRERTCPRPSSGRSRRAHRTRWWSSASVRTSGPSFAARASPSPRAATTP